MANDSITSTLAALRSDAARERTLASEAIRRAELIEARIAGFEEAANLLGGTSAEQPKRRPKARSAGGGSKGRQPGSITKRWRKILAALRHRSPFTPRDGADAIKRIEGREVRFTEVRRIFTGYVEQGHLRDLGEDEFEVTKEAIEQFDLAAYDHDLIAEHAGWIWAADENEPSNGRTVDGSETTTLTLAEEAPEW